MAEGLDPQDRYEHDNVFRETGYGFFPGSVAVRHELQAPSHRPSELLVAPEELAPPVLETWNLNPDESPVEQMHRLLDATPRVGEPLAKPVPKPRQYT